MTEKALVIDSEKCDGCRKCETACSVSHTGTDNPARSRVRVTRWDDLGLFVPVTCQNCDRPFCTEVCPAKACRRDPETGKVLIDSKKCIGCKTCILACPFSAPVFDKTEHVTIKCDFCENSPKCVEACEAGALRYLDTCFISEVRRGEFFKKFQPLYFASMLIIGVAAPVNAGSCFTPDLQAAVPNLKTEVAP